MTDMEALKRYMESRWGIRWTEQHAKDVSSVLKKSPAPSGSEPRQTLEPLVNGETYFFRYPIYLEILLESMRLRAEQGFQPRFRVLCAGCSTGEEVYSIAFTLLEAARRMKCKLEIRGVDLRTRAIETARAGVYYKWSLRNMSVPDQKRFLHANDDGTWSVAEPFRSVVEFDMHNLVEPLHEKPFDVILLCNVLIYMHDAAIRKVYQGLEPCVAEDSILITGPADPPPATAWFLQREYRGWPVYSRTAPARISTNIVEVSRPSPAEGSKRAEPATPRPAPKRKPPRPVEPGAVPAPSAPAEGTRVADEALWHAWAQGKLDSASEQIRQKVFFEPEHPLWRFLNGVILMEHGWLRKSRKEIEKAGDLLASYKPDQLISGLCSAEELRRMIDFWRQQHG